MACLALVLTFARDARASGTFKLKSTEATEVSGAWHLYVTIEMPKAPLTAHQSMKFLFTKTMAYERSLVDGNAEPVMNRQALQNQTPTVESLDVDFADPSGKVFKGTRFDFGLTRTRGYEAGEYKVEVRTSEGVQVGTMQTLILKGDNAVVDRRAMAFNAKEPKVRKVEGYDGGSAAGTGEPAGAAANQSMGEVTPTGVGQSFVPKEGLNKTPEEEIKVRPQGCGCAVPGMSASSTGAFATGSLSGLGTLGGLACLVGLAALGRRLRGRRRAHA